MRWLDERKYEDFADYQNHLIKYGKSIGVEVLSVQRQGIKTTFRIDGTMLVLKAHADGKMSLSRIAPK